MTDSRLRALERAVYDFDSDPASIAALIAASRRAGETVPGWMFDQQILPGREFAPGRAFEVYADLPGMGYTHLGTTSRGEGVYVPDHHAWWIWPPKVGKLWPAILDVVEEHQVPGLALDRANVTGNELSGLGQVSHLTWLSLSGCTRIGGTELDLIAEHLPQLQHLDLDRCARRLRVDHLRLRRMPNLIHLSLRDRAGDFAVREIVDGAPRLTRLRVGNSRLTNEGVEALAELEGLTRLELAHAGRVSAKGIRALAKIPRLMHLELLACARCKGPSLGELRRLERLVSLGYYPVGRWETARPVSADDARGLAKLKQLQFLTVVLCPDIRHENPETNAEVLRSLEQALPEVEITALKEMPSWRSLGPLGER